MKTFKTFLNEKVINEDVKIGDKVSVHYKKMSGDSVEKGSHTVTKVSKHDFEVDRPDTLTGENMKFKHNGLGKDYAKVKSGRVKGLSKSYGHYIKDITHKEE